MDSNPRPSALPAERLNHQAKPTHSSTQTKTWAFQRPPLRGGDPTLRPSGAGPGVGAVIRAGPLPSPVAVAVVVAWSL